MRVKRYEAATMQEAMQQVKRELGRDAVIIHSRKIKKGGAFGFFGKDAVEVVAAVDSTPVVQQPRVEEKRAVPDQVTPARGRVYSTGTQVQTAVAEPAPRTMRPLQETLHVVTPVESKSVPGTVPATNQLPSPTAAPSAAAAGGNDDKLVASLQSELSTLRKMLEQVNFQLQSAQGLSVLAPAWEGLQRSLLEQEVSAEYIAEIEAHVFQEVDQREWQDEAAIRNYVRRLLGQNLKTARSAAATAQSGPTVIALVGPTGVGKTTTVAKMAAQYTLFLKKTVGLITVDTYRIAAVEQLKTFAEIIGIPVEVSFTPPEMKLALAKMADKDVILVDTAGRSQRNEAQLAELQAFLGVAQPQETHLVLSATTKAKDLRDCLARFNDASFTHLIFTKLDETSSYGGILNSIKSSGCPAAYITTGQNVPEDIEEANSERLADLLLRGALV